MKWSGQDGQEKVDNAKGGMESRKRERLHGNVLYRNSKGQQSTE